MTAEKFLELDEDPDEALAVITGRARGYKPFAALVLAQAITAGRYPDGWVPLRELPAGGKKPRA
jgi:hypothetical protein